MLFWGELLIHGVQVGSHDFTLPTHAYDKHNSNSERNNISFPPALFFLISTITNSYTIVNP